MAHHRRHMTITRKDIERAERHLHRHRRDPGGKAGRMAQLKQTVTIGGTTFAMGMLKGYFGPMMLKLGGINLPGELLAFLGASVVAASGYAGKYSHTLADVADGIGAGYLHTLAAGYGDRMFQKNHPDLWGKRSNPLLAGSHFGALGSGSKPLTQAELRAMASAIRG